MTCDEAEPFASGMGPAEQKVWGWKDELPRTDQAWYGRFVGNRGSFLSPAMLAWLYPGDELRAGVGRRHYQRAVTELQKSLLVTAAGVQENRSGWPSALLDLTCRRSTVGGQRDHRLATGLVVHTLVEASPKELSRCLGWPVGEARARLELVAAGTALQTADRYRSISRGAP